MEVNLNIMNVVGKDTRPHQGGRKYSKTLIWSSTKLLLHYTIFTTIFFKHMLKFSTYIIQHIQTDHLKIMQT